MCYRPRREQLPRARRENLLNGATDQTEGGESLAHIRPAQNEGRRTWCVATSMPPLLLSVHPAHSAECLDMRRLHPGSGPHFLGPSSKGIFHNALSGVQERISRSTDGQVNTLLRLVLLSCSPVSAFASLVENHTYFLDEAQLGVIDSTNTMCLTKRSRNTVVSVRCSM